MHHANRAAGQADGELPVPSSHAYLYRYMTVMPKHAVERPTSDVPPFSPTYV